MIVFHKEFVKNPATQFDTVRIALPIMQTWPPLDALVIEITSTAWDKLLGCRSPADTAYI